MPNATVRAKRRTTLRVRGGRRRWGIRLWGGWRRGRLSGLCIIQAVGAPQRLHCLDGSFRERGYHASQAR